MCRSSLANLSLSIYVKHGNNAAKAKERNGRQGDHKRIRRQNRGLEWQLYQYHTLRLATKRSGLLSYITNAVLQLASNIICLKHSNAHPAGEAYFRSTIFLT
jgi:hypothetical protein